MCVNSKKAQTWSFDLIVAVVLFIVVVALFYSFLSSRNDVDATTTSLESGVAQVANLINCDTSSNQDICFITRSRVENAKLTTLTQQDYQIIRDALGVRGDFCIFIRDGNGAIRYLNLDNLSSYGSGDLALVYRDGEPVHCGDILS